MCIAIVCLPRCDITNLETNLIILIKPFFLDDQNVNTNVKHFLSFFEGLLFKRIRKIFLEGDNLTLMRKFLEMIYNELVSK